MIIIIITKFHNNRDSSDNPMLAPIQPSTGNAFYRWTALSNSDYISVFVMPITNATLTEVSTKNSIIKKIKSLILLDKNAELQ